jgi:hypothetical protein
MKLPEKCPACGGAATITERGTDEQYPWRQYSCDAQLVDQEGEIVINDNCRMVLEQAVAALNRAG